MELDCDLESRERLINTNSRAHYKNAPIWQTSFFNIQNLFRHIHRYFFSTEAPKTEDTVIDHEKSLLWINGLNYNVIFYQGMMLSQQQIVQYIGENAIELTTGESIRSNQKRIYLFQPQHIWLYPEIPEIDRNIRVGWYSHQHIMQWALGLRIAQITDKPEYEQTYPHREDGCVVNYFGVRASRSSLGQTSDKEAHKAKHDALMKIRPENTVLFGVSRGGATTFAALAEYRYENIKLCLLEGPPGSISSLFKVYFKYIPYLGKLLYNPYTAYLFLGHLHRTEKKYQAIEHADRFPLDVPLVIISSMADEIVCHKSSLNLALRIAAKRIVLRDTTSIAPVYFIQLDLAKHNYYTDSLSYPKDSARYQNWVHRIYKEFGLPYIEAFAQKADDEHHLSTIELTQGPLREQVMFQAQFKQDKDNRPKIRDDAFHDFEKTYNTLTNPEARRRTSAICAVMPLYAKKISNNYSFFSPNPIRVKLQQMAKDTQSCEHQQLSLHIN